MSAGSPPPSGAESLEERVRAGTDPALSLLAARGLLPIEPDRLIPLQVRFARGDGELAAAAREALGGLEARRVVAYVARGAGAAELAWFAGASRDDEVIEAVLRRRDVPRQLLVELAGRLSPRLQEVLIQRQDALVEEPAIADALEANPQLGPVVRRRLAEYREHLLRPEGAVEEPPPEAEGEASDEEVRRALAEVGAVEGEGEQEPHTGLTEVQVRNLPVPVRRRLARGAPRTLRALLVRDPNPIVARTVLTGNTLSDQEIEQVASSRAVHEDVLSEISRHREWVVRYPILLALARNPKTPLGVSIKLIPRLAVRDLRFLSKDRNVPDAVRTTAQRLYRIKRL